jgi:parallel beta-helix repeat protein
MRSDFAIAPLRLKIRKSTPTRRRSAAPVVDLLEPRVVLSTFLVTNLNDSGAGSFRQAIVEADRQSGSSTIDFGVSGTIHVGRSSLPAITRPLTIDGTTAPTYQDSPVLTVDFQGTKGLQFAAGSNGSSLLSLSIVGAGGAGVTLCSSFNTLQGNEIGVLPDGLTVDGNKGDGLRMNSKSDDNLIVSNVISGNAGNGIGVYGGDTNTIAMNSIGTNAAGTAALANGQNGILLTQGASGNTIGGSASGGNNPTQSVFVRPPQGNLISGNQGDGVFITGKATKNTLSGNFIGTSASGNSAIGNRLDGVAIVGANGNQLIGCTLTDSPFVYYNVLSGNGGNGLRITNSNNTTVHANFMGVGADNGTLVANGGDGLLVSGTSKQTQVGGVIPLGNVIAGNDRNGIEVKDKASGFTSFNTFAGIYAFLGAAPNQLDGILVTSTGGNNLIRTCIVSGNLGNGIEIGGNASGVQVTDTAVGTSTNIQSAIPNGGSGIVITGTAHNNFIGGLQPSVEKQVDVSSNQGYGINVIGKAHDNRIANANIGSGDFGINALGNTLGGIYLGSGTSKITIGGKTSEFQASIVDNLGAGITIQGSSQALIQGSTISRNHGDGILLRTTRNSKIGGIKPALGNQIVGNTGYGINQQGRNPGTVVVGNTVVGNGQGSSNV